MSPPPELPPAPAASAAPVMPAAPQAAAAALRRAGLREILPRVLTWFWLKTFGVTAFVWLFSSATFTCCATRDTSPS